MTVVVNGNPRPGSRTAALALAAGRALNPDAEPVFVDVAALGHRLLLDGDPSVAAALAAIRDADLLVVATPTYKATYTGALKVLLDGLRQGDLTGTTALTVVTAGTRTQGNRATAHLRELLRELGATVTRDGLVATEDRLASPETITELAGALAAG